MSETKPTVHLPILAPEIVDQLSEPFARLAPNQEAWLIDATFGGGGHSQAFLERFQSNPAHSKHRILAFDRDVDAIERGKARFSHEIESGKLTLIHSPFSQIGAHLEGRKVLGLLADLGVSSDQLDTAQRGFSFQSSGPLDMRMDASRGFSAYEFLKRISQLELEALLRDKGDERFSGRIARNIIEARDRNQLPDTTLGLADLIRGAVPAFARRGRIHPATRSFQAIRIAVNHEDQELDALLNGVLHWVGTGGRVAILSFHSGEDRMVKSAFRARSGKPKKPIVPSDEECDRNPRARSAKLRVLELQ